MSQESLTDAARGFIEAYNAADWNRLEAAMTPDCVYDEIGTGRRADGAHEVVDLFNGWKRAMPDSEGTVTSVCASDDTAALEVTWNGTLTGPMAGPQGEIAPTGKHQTTRASFTFRFEGDAIKESRQYFDVMSFMQQVGVLEAPTRD
jgi:steroid delta-isomerase-like uncharacterized protein